jgi:hypothetical protein
VKARPITRIYRIFKVIGGDYRGITRLGRPKRHAKADYGNRAETAGYCAKAQK